MMTRKYKIHFNKGRQYLLFHIGSSLRKFRTDNKCHAYYVAAENRKQRSGLFGHIHIPEEQVTPALFEELKAHEIYHAVEDWWTCRKGNVLSDKNEEIRALIMGEISRKIHGKIGV